MDFQNNKFDIRTKDSSLRLRGPDFFRLSYPFKRFLTTPDSSIGLAQAPGQQPANPLRQS